MSNEKMSGDDVLKIMDTDGRAVALYADTCGTGLRYKQWAAHLKRHDEAREAVAALIAERDGLRAARIAYASEFEPDAEGVPNVGSIHENIRKLKAEWDALREDAERYRHSFVMPNAAEGGLHYIIPGQYGMTSTKVKAFVDALIDAARANESA